MKIVVLDGYTHNPGDLSWDSFKELGELTVYERTDPKDIIDRIGDAEILITNKAVINRNIIESTNVKYIGVFATGYNVIDIDACNERGIVVCNVPEYSTEAVVQHTFAILFEITNNVYIHSKSVKEGKWSDCKDFSYTVAPLIELKGKTMGLIGYGNIGKGVAKAANAFGIKVIYNKPSGSESCDKENCRYAELEEIYKNSDIISLHCPMNNATKEIINKNSIGKMKNNVIIINTARGGLINERDLADALNSDRVSAYGCDVLSSEPPSTDNPIVMAKNTVITPHIAWEAKETRQRLMDIAAANLKSYLESNIQNRVN